MSQDATVGVAAFATAAGGPTDLVALDTGSDTLGILAGLGDGRFANPISLPTPGPTWRFASPTSPETATPTWRSSDRTAFPSGLATARRIHRTGDV